MIVLESKLLTRIKLCAELKITSFLIAYNSYTNRYLQAEKKPAAQIAHLVFADTQAKTKKKQKSYFLPTLNIPLAEKNVN